MFPPSLRQSVQLWQVALLEGYHPRPGVFRRRSLSCPLTPGRNLTWGKEQLECTLSDPLPICVHEESVQPQLVAQSGRLS